MKSKLLKLANVKSEQEFYKKYPTEDAFLKAFPKMKSELKQFANGGPGDGDGDSKRKTKYPVLDVSKIKPKSTADSVITWAQLPIAQAAIASRMAKGEFNNLSTDQLKDSVNNMYKSFGVNPDLLYNSGKTMDSALSYYKNENGDYVGFIPKDAYAPKAWNPEYITTQTRSQAMQSSKGKKVNSDFAIININDITGDKKQVTLPGRDSERIIVSLKDKDKTKPLMLKTRNDAAETNLLNANPNLTGWNTVKNYYNDPSFNQEINALSPTSENPNNKVTRTFTPNFIMKQRAYGGLQEYADGGKIMKDIGAGAYGIGEGILDTATFGLTDQLTDKGYTALQKAGGTTNEEELKQQNAIRGGGNIAGAVGTAIFTGGATTGAAIGQGAKGANEIVQNTNIVPDEYKQTAGSIINLAGMAGSMAAGSPSSLSNPAATQFMNSNFTQGVQQMNKYKPFMNAVGFRNGGIQQYVDGGMGPNAEVEKQENTVAPDGTFTQYNGPSHEDGGIETTLDQGEMIFSDKLKPIGSKKTYAQLNKSFNTQKEDELLNDPKTNAVQKLTAAMMRRAKLTQSIALFQNQEQQKEAKVQAYADKMGVPVLTPNSQAEEQMANESQEMGEEMPMARMGGMIKRADGSYSKRGLWDNIRANKGSGKKPTPEMLKQEAKIKAQYAMGGPTDPPLTPEELKWLATSLRGIESAKYLSGRYPDNTMPGGTADRIKELTGPQKLQLQKYMQNTDVITDMIEGITPNIEFFNPKPKNSKLAMGGMIYANGGSFDNPGFKALPEAVQQKIMANYEMGGMLKDTEMDYTPMEGEEYMEYKKGGIYIKPENRGKFSAAAKRAGMGTQAYAKHILANKENYSSTLVKRANFARNAAKWHHEMGGLQQFAEAGMYGDPLKPAWQTSSTPTAASAGIANQGNTFVASSPVSEPRRNLLAIRKLDERTFNNNKPSNKLLSGETKLNFGPKIKLDDDNWSKNNLTFNPLKYKGQSKSEGESFDWQNAAGIACVGLLSNAGNIYNIARGLQKPEDWQYERATAQYLDPSADLAENARMYQEAKRASQYASAGNATNYLANTAAGRAAKMNADRLVRTNYSNANAQIANQLGLFNTQIANAEMNAKQQDEAQRRNLIGQGMSGIGENVLGFTGDLMRMNAYNNYFDNPDFKKTTKGLPTLGGTRSSTRGSSIGKTGV